MMKYNTFILFVCLALGAAKATPMSKTERELDLIERLLKEEQERMNEQQEEEKKLARRIHDLPAPLMVRKDNYKRNTGVVVTLTQSQKNLIVALHNTARRNVNPPATNTIPDMTWSDTLANTAETWGSQCLFQHNPDPSGDHLGYVGENIAYSLAWPDRPSDNDTITNGVQGWVCERVYYNYGNNQCEGVSVCPNEMGYDPASKQCRNTNVCNTCQHGQQCMQVQCGHYTQVVWTDTTQVGCAVVHCGDYESMLFCNYYPGGNYIGQKPYD